MIKTERSLLSDLQHNAYIPWFPGEDEKRSASVEGTGKDFNLMQTVPEALDLIFIVYKINICVTGHCQPIHEGIA